ncbi:hypothetical protein ACFOOL_10570 [Devosia honganensis]|uniref:Uncharacterized protein n=1 Tax=Devosia honganensis TaxID=1610527 RepID=A0ABV7X3R9_9HYPH
MSARNTLLFGAALVATTAAIAYDHVTKPVPPRPAAQATGTVAGAAPCAAGAPALAAPPPPPAASPQLTPPPPPPAQAAPAPQLAPPPPAPRQKPAGEEAPDLVVTGG